MRKLITYLKPYTLIIALALFMMVIELTVELAQPLLIARMIDEGIVVGELSVVLRLGLFMVVLSFVSLVAGVLNSFLAAHISQQVGWQLRQDLFTKIQRFSLHNVTRFNNAKLTTRLTNDVTQIQNTLLMSMRIMARAPALVVGGVIMALVVNWRIAIILLVTVPLLFVLLLWLFIAASSRFRKVQHHLDELNTIVHENIQAIRLIKAYVKERSEQKRFVQGASKLRDQTISAFRYVEVTMPIILLLMNVSILAILWFGQAYIQVGQATTGEIVAIINYSTRTAMALGIFSMIIMNLSRTKASSARLFEVMESPVDDLESNVHQGETTKLSGKLEFRNVSFAYDPNQPRVLKKISFTINPGEKVAILGATGSGKTTLMQLVSRLYEPNEGSILYDDQPGSTYATSSIRAQVGYVAQHVHLFSGQLKEVVAFGKQNATESEIIDALERAQLSETIEKLPEGIKTRIGQKGINLSGGQKQRLTIARALLRNPAILLLDDSTSALDMKTEHAFLRALEDLRCTTLLVTQKVATTKKMDRIMLLDDGELIATGTHKELLKSSTLYREITKSQQDGDRL
ncbi:ABC transporter ATP-binding protein [Geomicrobium sediminis]|uniref:ATP-binding cassette subfamily B protein n=1 Tax=Geomicrobium sediminis TaxID=1347788 RepID=A0ABS2PBR8_9BACL|nr:ABC transporter ATP-binding protein [Geomicrobium sediminis]MBM7632436.1 ATP-binding cassette subfamily B protein [Geomicrobium sediminis]